MLLRIEEVGEAEDVELGVEGAERAGADAGDRDGAAIHLHDRRSPLPRAAEAPGRTEAATEEEGIVNRTFQRSPPPVWLTGAVMAILAPFC